MAMHKMICKTIATGFFTFISLHAIAGNGDSTIVPQKDAVIRGKVTDKNGEPLNGAEISWNGHQVSQTDEDGQFEFSLDASRTGIISVSYPELNTAVRNYHPSMGKINYAIRLCPLKKCRIDCDSIFIEIPSIHFAAKSIELTDDHQSLLAELAKKMRDNPDVILELTSGAGSPPEIRRAKYMLSLVMNWLVDREGIAEDRIQVNSNLDHPELVKTVEIKIVRNE